MNQTFAILDKFCPPPKGISIQRLLKAQKLKIIAGKYPPFVKLWVMGAWLVVSSTLIILTEARSRLLYRLVDHLLDKYPPIAPIWFVGILYPLAVSIILVVLLIAFLFIARFYRVKIIISSNEFTISGMHERRWPLTYYMKIGLANLRDRYQTKQHVELIQISPKLDKRGLDSEQIQWIDNLLSEMVISQRI